jgi:maltooligosyltrehalose trehalohydrolase
VRCAHTMPFGARAAESGGIRFSLWAPGLDAVALELGLEPSETHAMEKEASGFHSIAVPRAKAGDLYRFVLPDGLRVPDPASRFNPRDVHGPSQVIDPCAYSWRNPSWTGRPWEETVLYELHVGAFTPEGTFTAAKERLPELADLGITMIELMPVADFPGRRNWGYDGVLPFAPDASYGTPDDLKALIDAAHGLGLSMMLDVVYNHFGPEGNYLHAYCPEFFNPAHPTPWGAAINFDGPASGTVRDYFVHNALYWVEEFRFDGLRLDSIHAIRDDSARPIVREIQDALRDGPGLTRHVFLALENDANHASLLNLGRAGGGSLTRTTQWNDDLHHAAHVLIAGESDGYYEDYAAAPLENFGRALAEGFVYQGQASPFRNGEPRGEPATHLPSSAFISFLQNHDQVGNRAFGERLHTLADPALLRAARACLLLSPHIPMFFMGEEFLATTSFLFFCDFGPELADAVARGRREEFKRFAAFSDEAARARIPDPSAVSTFTASKLRWAERTEPLPASELAEIRELLAIRSRHVTPRLRSQESAGRFQCDRGLLRVEWRLGTARLRLLANFGDDPVSGVNVRQETVIQMIGTERPGSGSGPWVLAKGAVIFTLEEPIDA